MVNKSTRTLAPKECIFKGDDLFGMELDVVPVLDLVEERTCQEAKKGFTNNFIVSICNFICYASDWNSDHADLLVRCPDQVKR